MAEVTAYTAAKTEELMDEQIIAGEVVGDDLILTRRDLTTINAGPVVGPQGPAGTDTSIVIATSSTRPTGGDLFEGLGVYETDTQRLYFYNGAEWVYHSGLWICTSSTRPASPFEGMEIYETDTLRKYIYSLSGWRHTFGPAVWTEPTLLNGWTNFGGATQDARYTKVNTTVYIEGSIVPGTSTAFTLPSGYRPEASLIMPGTKVVGGVDTLALLKADETGVFWPGEGGTRINITCSFRAST